MLDPCTASFIDHGPTGYTCTVDEAYAIQRYKPRTRLATKALAAALAVSIIVYFFL